MELDQVTVESIANKATGTYEQAGAVLGKAEDYIKAAIAGGSGWFSTLPGEQTRLNVQGEIQGVQSQLALSSYPEQICPFWEQARNLLFRARAEYNAIGEGRARQLDNLLMFPRDLAVSAGETVGAIASGVGEVAGQVAGGLASGLGMTGLVVLGAAGLVAYFLLRKGA